MSNPCLNETATTSDGPILEELLWIMSRSRSWDTGNAGYRNRILLFVENHLKWFLTLPGLFLLTVLFGYPLARAFEMSFFQTLSTGTEFVGFENYGVVLTDPRYRNALWVTAKFVVFATGLEMLFGTTVAFLLNKQLRFRGGIQTAILIPIVISPTVVALLWQLLYQSDGLLTYIFETVFGSSPNWLADPGIALWSIIIADVWQMTPLVVLVVLAGLQSVPSHVRDAAVMDGAGPVRQLVDITFPYIKDLIVLILIIRLIGTMRVFAKVFVLTGGGPAGSTNVISLALYQEAFRFGNVGMASAMAVVLLLIAVIIAVTFARIADIRFR